MDEKLKGLENFKTDYLDEIYNHLGDYMKLSLMTDVQRRFINGIIQKFKPKKILEVGISAGVNSAIILNIIKDIKNTNLYSIDILEKWHADNTKLSGFVAEEKCKNLTNKWKLHRGNVVAKFMNEIGNYIDLVILDTAHVNPGEFLDFIMIKPYLKKNAVIVIHDIQLHNTHKDYDSTCGLLFACLPGKKFYPDNDGDYNKKFGFPNIGAVILDENIDNYMESIFFLLTLPWRYAPTNEHNEYIINSINTHYNQNLADVYKKLREFNISKLNYEAPIISPKNEINYINNRIDNILVEIENNNRLVDKKSKK